MSHLSWTFTTASKAYLNDLDQEEKDESCLYYSVDDVPKLKLCVVQLALCRKDNQTYYSSKWRDDDADNASDLVVYLA